MMSVCLSSLKAPCTQATEMKHTAVINDILGIEKTTIGVEYDF